MEKVAYRKSIKKQAMTAIGGFLVIIIFGWQLAPVNTLGKTIVSVLIVLTIFLFMLWIIKKYCRSANCPSCQADIFEVINAANPSLLSFNYCPNCGAKIEI